MSFPFVSAGLAVAGGVIGGIGANRQARARNNALEEWAINTGTAQQEALNENITRLRLQSIDANRIASDQLQARLGQAEATLYGGTFRGGHSINRILAQQVGDAAADRASRDMYLRHNIQNIETQKANVRTQVSNQAHSQMVNVGQATLGGVMQGAQMGYSVGSGLESLGSVIEQRGFMSDLNARLEANPTDAFANAQLRAFNAGVPVEFLSGNGAISQAALRPFQIEQQLSGIRSNFLLGQFDYQRAVTQFSQGGLLRSALDFGSLMSSPYANGVYDPTTNPLLNFAR